MNRIRNWSILSTLFILASLGVMSFTNQPALAWAIMVPGLICVAMAVIRFDDHRKALDLVA